MPNGHSPTVRRRRLAAELRRLREERGRTIEHVARELEMHPTTLSRIETGRRGILPRDLKPLLEVYGIVGDQKENLLILARQARQRGWWQSYGDLLPSEYSTLIGLEAEAGEIRTYQHQIVPGLLQTEDYARAVIRAFRRTDTDEEIEQRVRVRLERQARLSTDPALNLWVVLDEAVLRRTVSGPEVMRHQLQHLVEMARRRSVTLQVLPFAAGEHAAMTSPFVILRFPEPLDPDVVYLENHTGGLYVEEPPDVTRYTLVFDHLGAAALSPRESMAFIAQAAQDLP
jgi:transcriptional regulator with XRE-family HTH domain